MHKGIFLKDVFSKHCRECMVINLKLGFFAFFLSVEKCFKLEIKCHVIDREFSLLLCAEGYCMMAYHSQQEEKVSVIMGQLVSIFTILLPCTDKTVLKIYV